MEHTHPNVTVREGEKLSGEEIAHDNPPAESTALSNTSQPLGISPVQLEALTNSIGQMMSLQVNTMLSAFESKFLAQIKHVAWARDSGRSRSSSEARSRPSYDDGEWREEDDVPSEDSKEVDEDEDNTDEEDPGSAEGSMSSSSNEQGAPNLQQRTPGGEGKW